MKNIYIFLTIAMLLISACSSVKVTSDYDKTIDFSTYKTFEYYGWTEESDKILNRFDKERIENAFGEEFDKFPIFKFRDFDEGKEEKANVLEITSKYIKTLTDSAKTLMEMGFFIVMVTP